MPTAKLCYHRASDQLATSEAPMSPSLGSSNLLDRLKELGKPIYLSDHQFIINEYNSGTVDGRDAQDKAWGKGVGPSCAKCTTLLDLQLFTNPEALGTLS